VTVLQFISNLENQTPERGCAMQKDKKVKRHEDRKDLAGEHPFGDAGQLVLLFVFLIVWAADSFFLKLTTQYAIGFPGEIQISLMMITFLCSAYLASSGLRIVFTEVREQPAVITKGVFGIVRHPIYLGSILFYLGLILSTLSLLSLVVWFIIILFYNFISSHEEKLLLQRFGRDYKDYMRQVPMWLPRLKKQQSV